MNKTIKTSLTNALLVAVYVALISLLLLKANQLFGDTMINFWGPFAFLMLFVLSAAVVCWLIAGQPILLYLDGKKKTGLKLLTYTIAWLFLITVIVLLVQIII